MSRKTTPRHKDIRPHKGRYPVPIENRRRYDVWSRTQSDTFRWKVAEALEESAGLDLAHLRNSGDPYSYLLSIPNVSWDNGATPASIAVEQLKALFSKDEDLRSPIDKEGVALASFRESEVRCKEVNDAFLGDGFASDSDAACILYYAQWKIAQILGDAPQIDDLVPTFGPGAAVTCRKKTSARFKLSTPPSISKPSLDILSKMIEGVPRWYQLHGTVKVVPGELEFVNKNFKTHRAIVLGPSLTGMYQRAVGRKMKEKLLQSGIDLFNGQSKQRERARIASLTGDDATVDLKAASDSNAYMLILSLLPFDWFELLDQLRDDRVRYHDEVIQLEKFSSMGNGYTFELETVIFYGLVYGIARHFGIPFHRNTCGIYGDDIIVPTQLAQRVVEQFPKFGLLVNKEKTFIEGPFRESCGGDYVLGVDVRPYFIRGRMTHHGLVCFYNHLMRKPHQDPGRKIRDLILSYIPPQFQNFGMDGFGDGHLISMADFRTYAQPLKRELGWSGWTFETYVEIPTRDKTEQIGDQLLPAYSLCLKSIDQVPIPTRLEYLRGPYRDAFIRQILLDIGDPLDHFVLRKSKDARVKARRVRIYVLGPA